jgi:hypothetical protein
MEPQVCGDLEEIRLRIITAVRFLAGVAEGPEGPLPAGTEDPRHALLSEPVGWLRHPPARNRSSSASCVARSTTLTCHTPGERSRACPGIRGSTKSGAWGGMPEFLERLGNGPSAGRLLLYRAKVFFAL